MTMSKNPTFLVTYTGEGVVSLARVGLFQTGTMAVVGAEEAEAARAQGHFQVRRFGEPGEPAALPPPAPAISPNPPPVKEVIGVSPPTPPAIAEPPAAIAEPPAAIAEPPAGEPTDTAHTSSSAAPSEEPHAAVALGGETPAPDTADDAHELHESHDDGEAPAHPEESGGEGAPPRRKRRR